MPELFEPPEMFPLEFAAGWSAEAAMPPDTHAATPAFAPGRMPIYANDPHRLACVRLLGYAPYRNVPSKFGTGVLIAPDLILTVAHNVFDSSPLAYGTTRAGGYAGQVRVESPWLAIPPQVAMTQRFVAADGWTQAGKAAFDIALIRLSGPLPAPAQPVQPTVGAWINHPGADLYAYGFPGPAMALEVSPGDIMGPGDGRIFYSADTVGGFSGGPLMLAQGGQYVLAGLHRAGPGEPPIPNGCNGALITQGALQWFAQMKGVL